MIEYEQRDAVLRAIGFGSYAEYLNSRLWARIRHRVLKKRKTCVCCGEPANEVHHKDYSLETMKGERLSGLSPLCSTCHDIAEFDADGSKATLGSANQKIDMLSALDRTPMPRRQSPLWQRPVELSDKALKRERAKYPSKRKMILAAIPAELIPSPSPEVTTKRPSIPRGMRMLMPALKTK
jgi:hypothetical protein